MIQNNSTAYGVGDASFRAAGGESGIAKLVDAFYDIMSSDPRFSRIHEMHPPGNAISRDKLARFLCGWLGGPPRYREKYGAISIPRVHQHLDVATEERDQWLTCMGDAIDMQPFSASFSSYLKEQFFVPAEAVRKRIAARTQDSLK